MDHRGDESVKEQNIELLKELERLQNVERDKKALQDEKSKALDKISSLQESNRLFQDTHSEEIKELKNELEKSKERGLSDTTSGYSEEQILKLVKSLSCYSGEDYGLEVVMKELKEKLNISDKPFKWQVWKGDKIEKEKIAKKTKISMNDLGKGLKI